MICSHSCPSLGCVYLLVPGRVAGCTGVVLTCSLGGLGHLYLIFVAGGGRALQGTGRYLWAWSPGPLYWACTRRGRPPVTTGTLILWPWGPHLGPPSFSSWVGRADVAEMCGLGSLVFLGAALRHCPTIPHIM